MEPRRLRGEIQTRKAEKARAESQTTQRGFPKAGQPRARKAQSRSQQVRANAHRNLRSISAPAREDRASTAPAAAREKDLWLRRQLVSARAEAAPLFEPATALRSRRWPRRP